MGLCAIESRKTLFLFITFNLITQTPSTSNWAFMLHNTFTSPLHTEISIVISVQRRDPVCKIATDDLIQKNQGNNSVRSKYPPHNYSIIYDTWGSRISSQLDNQLFLLTFQIVYKFGMHVND